jgi:hypothetical protein
MPTVKATHDFVSIGQLAAHLQKTVRVIERAAIDLEIAPAMRLNLVPYFSAEQIERLTAHLSTKGTR